MLGSKLTRTLVLAAVSFTAALAYAQSAPQSSLNLPLEKPKGLNSPLSGEWSFMMGGANFSEGRDEGAGAFLYADAKFNYQFLESLRAVIHPRLNLFSARVQERFDDDTFENRLGLYEGYLTVEPIEFIELRAGALAQNFQKSGMLVSGWRTFPGLQQILKYERQAFQIRAISQQAVPTSHTMNTERQTQEKLPTFTSEMLDLAVQGQWFEFNVYGGHYRWSNIPDVVVFESRRLGNEGVGDNIAGSDFRYQHEGLFGGTEICLCGRGAFGFVGEYQRVRNWDAPSNAADAQLVGGGPRIKFGDQQIDVRYRQFFIESDATVAAYNKSRYGNTNRVGDNVEFTWAFKDKKFAIVSELYQARTINRDANQRDMSTFYLGVETEYAPF